MTDTADRQPREPRKEVEVPFEPSRTGLERVGELAAQLAEVMRGLSPEIRGQAESLVMGTLPLTIETTASAA